MNSENLIAFSLPKGQGEVMASILLVNFLQVILSFLFFAYNGLFSSMLLMKKWSRFVHKRKILRVIRPIGMQRFSY